MSDFAKGDKVSVVAGDRIDRSGTVVEVTDKTCTLRMLDGKKEQTGRMPKSSLVPFKEGLLSAKPPHSPATQHAKLRSCVPL